MTVSARDVKALRDATGAGMMDAKKALTAADGDMETARQILREQGLAKADARAARSNDQGTIALAGDSRTVAVAQLKCETDFSAKNEAFTALAQALADSVLADGPAAADQHAAGIEDLRADPQGEHRGRRGRASRSSRGQHRRLVPAPPGRTRRGQRRGRGKVAASNRMPCTRSRCTWPSPSRSSSARMRSPPARLNRSGPRCWRSPSPKASPSGPGTRSWTEGCAAGTPSGSCWSRVLHGEKTAVKQSLGNGSLVRFLQVMIGD